MPDSCLQTLPRLPARQRTIEQGCSRWVSIEVANLDDSSATEQFDAVLGRYILLYQPDPAAAIARLTRFLKPGGIVLFREVDFAIINPSFPQCELYDQIHALNTEVFRRVGFPPDFGVHLSQSHFGRRSSFPCHRSRSRDRWRAWLVFDPVGRRLAKVLLPRIRNLQLTLPPGIALDHTLAGKLEEEVVAIGSQIVGPIQYGAWTRNPF